MTQTTERAVLRQAAQRVSLAELALWLGAPTPLLEDWMRGLAAIPERQFLLVVDLLDKLGARPSGVPAVRARSNVRQLRPRLSA
jgi:hypothetical protein